MSGETVRLSVTKLDLEELGQPGELLLDLEETTETAAERAIAWAQVRGYDRLVPVLERTLSGPAPESGFAVVLNKPHELLIFATWPWCPKPHPIAR